MVWQLSPEETISTGEIIIIHLFFIISHYYYLIIIFDNVSLSETEIWKISDTYDGYDYDDGNRFYSRPTALFLVPENFCQGKFQYYLLLFVFL